MRPMMAWAHDLRCTPTSLANKNPAADNSRGCYRWAKTVPPVVTVSQLPQLIGPSIGVAAIGGEACAELPVMMGGA